MTTTDLIALARSCADTTRYQALDECRALATGVLALFGSIPDWPCGWSRAVIADPTEENLGTTRLHVRAMDVTYDPDEAIAVGLDLFLCGLEARIRTEAGLPEGEGK